MLNTQLNRSTSCKQPLIRYKYRMLFVHWTWICVFSNLQGCIRHFDTLESYLYWRGRCRKLLCSILVNQTCFYLEWTKMYKNNFWWWPFEEIDGIFRLWDLCLFNESYVFLYFWKVILQNALVLLFFFTRLSL